jgi:hypothetical protein
MICLQCLQSQKPKELKNNFKNQKLQKKIIITTNFVHVTWVESADVEDTTDATDEFNAGDKNNTAKKFYCITHIDKYYNLKTVST